jgi:hypothetical protein
MSDSNLKNEDDFDETILAESEDSMQDVDEVFKQYDENSDGRIDHSEYVAKHKTEVGSGGISAFMDRILDDEPALRGQRLWVMFALSVVLVAGMNAYAMVREPEMVEIGELVEHTNEVVRVEGVVVSWVEDPYGSGEDRINIIIEDDTGVAQLRWYRPGEIPMLGTTVTATGDVIEYEGRIWLQALGSGALSWNDDDVPDAPEIALSTIAANPENFSGEAFTITGYISKSVEPNLTFFSLDLRDHPTYGNNEHQINMIIHSATGRWLEAGQKVEVTAVLEYSQKFMKWSIHVQGPEIRIDGNHVPEPEELSWSGVETWSYSSGNLVSLIGEVQGENLVGPDGEEVCILNAGDLSSFQGEDILLSGRLLWSTSKSGWCIDASLQEFSGDLVNVDQAEDLLAQLIRNPQDTLNESENSTHYWVFGFAYGSEMMNQAGETKIIIADGVYPNINAKFDAYVPTGHHTGWLEDGQALLLNVTARWDNTNARIVLDVHSLNLTAPAPDATPYALTSGAPEWYDLDKMKMITGNLVTIENETYLQKEGGQQRILIDTVANSIGTDSIHENMTLTWTGRLIEVADDESLAHHYMLDDADVTDSDGDGLSDDAEDALGYDSDNTDSDGDGESDRAEVENAE